MTIHDQDWILAECLQKRLEVHKTGISCWCYRLYHVAACEPLCATKCEVVFGVVDDLGVANQTSVLGTRLDGRQHAYACLHIVTLM